MWILKIGHMEKVSHDRIKLVNWSEENIDGNMSHEYFDDHIRITCKGREIGAVTRIEEIK